MTSRFAWRFDPRSLAVAVALFVLLAMLATLGARAGWLRSFFGDVLAVAWVYFVLGTAIAARPLWLALAALGVGCALEAAQYVAAVWHWKIANPVLRIVVGSTPDWLDVLAYALGASAVLLLEAGLARVAALRAGRPTASAP